MILIFYTTKPKSIRKQIAKWEYTAKFVAGDNNGDREVRTFGLMVAYLGIQLHTQASQNYELRIMWST